MLGEKAIPPNPNSRSRALKALDLEIDQSKIEKYNKIYLEGKYSRGPGLGRKNPYLWW